MTKSQRQATRTSVAAHTCEEAKRRNIPSCLSLLRNRFLAARDPFTESELGDDPHLHSSDRLWYSHT